MPLGGLVVGWEGIWILGAITMGLVRSLALVTSAGGVGTGSAILAVADLDLVHRMGKPIPDGIFYKKSINRQGLTLPRGPDPRSYNVALAIDAAAGRTIFGLQM